LVLLVVGLGIYLIYVNAGLISEDTSDVPTAVARFTTLIDKVVEQGELESQSTITGTCEIDNRENKLIFLAPEGSKVTKGQVVARFDTSEIDKQITERKARVNEEKTEVESAEQDLKVQINENASAIRKAKQDLQLADLDLKKYEEGDYLVSKSDIEGTISEAQTAFDKARRDREDMRALVKQGFRQFAQLREAEQVVKSAELRLKNGKQKLESLVKFEHVKSLAEFSGKATEAKFLLEAAETTAAAKIAQAKDRLNNKQRGLAIQERRLEEEKENLAKHEMTAPQAGTFTYGRNRWDDEKAHEGGTIWRGQPVFVLPDMNRMQVKVGIHESLVSKVKVKQKAIIHVDAFSDKTLYGVVDSVAVISSSTRRKSSNNYDVVVTIDDFPKDMKLKPGMTAEVEVYVGKYVDVLAVPIQAVTSFGNKKYVFVKNSKRQFESREVKVGESNLSFVAIKEGLKKNQTIALDAYQRGLASFDPDDLQSDNREGDLLAMTPAEQAASEVADAAGKKAAEDKKKAEEKEAEAKTEQAKAKTDEEKPAEITELAESTEEKIAASDEQTPAAAESSSEAVDGTETVTTPTTTISTDSDRPILE